MKNRLMYIYVHVLFHILFDEKKYNPRTLGGQTNDLIKHHNNVCARILPHSNDVHIMTKEDYVKVFHTYHRHLIRKN